MLQLTNVERLLHVGPFLSDGATSWFEVVRTTYGAAMTWDLFLVEFHKEYITDGYKRNKQQAFLSLEQGNMTVKEYVGQFDKLYRYVRNLFPTDELKIERFK